jgi:phosphoglycerate kinase
MAEDCIGQKVDGMVNNLKRGDLLLLENVRYHPEERNNVREFARALAELADIYVNDAFGVCHRTHTSIVGVSHYVPAVAGLLLDLELKKLGTLLESPEYPFAGIFGGAKVVDKVGALENIMDRLDFLLIGGVMAILFLRAKGYKIGQSKIDFDEVDIARMLIDKANRNGTKLVLPSDVVVANQTDSESGIRIITVSVQNVPANMSIVDIGKRTLFDFEKKLDSCRTVFWNGPMGIYEVHQFATGTKHIAHYLANLRVEPIVAGGSTAAVIDDLELTSRMGFISMGGGAALEFLSGRILPGIEVLPDIKPRVLSTASRPAQILTA